MPTLIFLIIAYQTQHYFWRYSLLILAAINLIFNLSHHAWLLELYTISIASLLFMLNPHFLSWWRQRDTRNNPDSFRQFIVDTYLIAKHNKLKFFYWVFALVAALALVYLYTVYTEYYLLGWLLAIFLAFYILKHLLYSILPPEWVFHDINTGYVFLSIFIAWGAAYLMNQVLGTNFILPMILAVIFSLIGSNLLRQNTRFLIPGCALIMADMVWQIIRYIQNNMDYTPPVIVTAVVLIISMVIGLIWLIKKPAILPILYLTLFQLFRFVAFTYQATDRLLWDKITTAEVTYYILYLVCWMYIAPLLFWFTGLLQLDSKPEENLPKHVARPNKRFDALLAQDKVLRNPGAS